MDFLNRDETTVLDKTFRREMAVAGGHDSGNRD